MKKVRCCQCGWEGAEDQLLFIPSQILDEAQDACPTCKTDEYLLDLK